MADHPLTRSRGTPEWDGVLRATGIVAAGAAALALVWDRAAMLAAFLLITVWVHGPVSPVLPAAYEPTLLYFGTLFPPLLIAVIGTLGNAYVEYLDYHLFRSLDRVAAYRRIREHPLFARAVAAFRRRPFLTVWTFAWSPLPYWMMRLLAPAARYPVRRYLLATALGRFPRFWLLAAIGARFAIPPLVLGGIAGGSAVLMLALVAWKTSGARDTRRPAAATLVTDHEPLTV